MILDKYEDWELAYFIKYMLDSYTTGTREKILDYLKNIRKFNFNQVEELIEKSKKKVYNDFKERCPRCKTEKIRTDMVDWAIPLYHAGAEDEMAALYEIRTGKTYMTAKITCNVCGHIITDPNNRTLKEKILGVLFDNPMWSAIRQILTKD